MEINDLQQCAPHSLYHNYTRTPPPPSTFRKNLLRSKFRHRRRQARGAVLTPPQLCLCRSPFLTHSLAAHYFRFAPLFAAGFSGRKAGARAALTMTLHCVVKITRWSPTRANVYYYCFIFFNTIVRGLHPRCKCSKVSGAARVSTGT